MAGVENKWAKSGHLRNRSIPSGEAFKTPEKTCQAASKRPDFLALEVWVGAPPDTNECATPVEPSGKGELSPH